MHCSLSSVVASREELWSLISMSFGVRNTFVLCVLLEIAFPQQNMKALASCPLQYLASRALSGLFEVNTSTGISKKDLTH